MESAKKYRTLLVATDGSAEASDAVEHGIQLARQLGAELRVVYVVDTHAAQLMAVLMPEAVHGMQEEGRALIDDVVKRAREVGVDAEGLLVEGRPGEQICQVADEREADIVVVGAAGKSALSRVLLGSVSEYVLHHTRRPVLVIRGGATHTA